MIPVKNKYPKEEDDLYESYGEWKEYHTNDIAEMKFWTFMLGWFFGAFMGGIACSVYFLR